MALGVTAPNILAELRNLPMVPPYILDWGWAFQLGFFLLAMLVMASIFYSRVEWFRNLRPMPNMPLKDALDYIVNDSTAMLKQSAPPQLMEYGPMKGHIATEKGVEHMDALRQLTERVISGDIILWGYREREQMMTLPQFEDTIREIPTLYFDRARIEPVVAWHYSKNSPDAVPNREIETFSYRYSGLMTFREGVQRVWPPKNITYRFWERRIKRKPRITYD